MAEIRKLPISLFSVFLINWLIAGCGDSGNNEKETTAFDVEEVLECIPSTEICDGKDNDCDGETDEEFPEMNTMCINDSETGCLWRSTNSCFYGTLHCNFPNYLGDIDSLTAQVVSCNSIKLNWTYQEEEGINTLGFVIQRKADTEKKYKDIVEVSLDTNEYLDTDVIPNATYFYKVRARGEKNDSFCSNEVFTTVVNITTEEVVEFDQIKWLYLDFFNPVIAADVQFHLHLAFCGPEGKLYYGTNSSGDWILTDLQNDEVGCGGLSIATDSNNKAYIFNFGRCGGNPDLYYHTNVTGEWQTKLITWWAWCDVAAPNAVIDNNGNVHFVYEADGGYGGGLGLNYALITQDETQIIHISDVGFAPTIALDNQFILHLLFLDPKSETEPSAFKYGTKITNEQWNFQVIPKVTIHIARMAFDNLNVPHVLFTDKQEDSLYHLWFENNNWEIETAWSNPGWWPAGSNPYCKSIAINKKTDTIHGLCGGAYFYKKNGKWFPVGLGSFYGYDLVLDQNGQAHVFITEIIIVEKDSASGAIKHLTIQECK